MKQSFTTHSTNKDKKTLSSPWDVFAQNPFVRLAIFSKEFQYLFVNEAYARTFDSKPQDLLGMLHFDLFPNHEHQMVFEDVINNNHPALLRYRPFSVEAKEERLLNNWEWNLVPLGIQGEAFNGVMKFLINLPEQYITDQSARRDAALLNKVEQIAHLGHWNWNIVSGDLSWSDEIYRIFGLKPQQFAATYEGFLNSVHPDDREKVVSAVNESVANKAAYSVEHRVLRPNGDIRVVHELGEVTYDQNGQPLNMIGAVKDVTELKQAQDELESLNRNLDELVRLRTAELEDERAFTQTILDIASAMIMVLDRDGNILRFNKTCESVTGLTSEAVCGKPIWDLFADDTDAPISKLYFDDKTKKSPPDTQDHHWITNTGEKRLINWRYSTLNDKSGDFQYLIATGIDITVQKQMEKELIVAKDFAEQANQAKSDFLSRMSHELRTPLNAILGFSQLLQMDLDNPLNSEQLDQIDEIIGSGNHLLNLINEVLDLSRVEAGKFTLSMEPVDIGAVIDQALTIIKPMAEQQRITINYHKSGTQSIFAFADNTRVKQILLNLLSNAIKYNRENGAIDISIEETDKRVTISVRDQGYGLNKDELGKLFRPFERLKAEGSNIQGTGIGLTLSKRFAELLQGDIQVTSTPGMGSTFSLVLNKPESADQMMDPLTTNEVSVLHLSGKKVILYIEDNVSNQKLVKTILDKQPDLELLIADNPSDGLLIAKSHQPDLIIMDINLPQFDGIEAMKRLRADPATRNIPSIAYSADITRKSITRGMEAGFKEYLEKPIEAQKLIEALKTHLTPKA